MCHQNVNFPGRIQNNFEVLLTVYEEIVHRRVKIVNVNLVGGDKVKDEAPIYHNLEFPQHLKNWSIINRRTLR